MDPFGLSLGAVSLVFQLFAGCMQAYKLLSEARGMEKTYRFYQVRFKAEQFRLLDWATVARLPQTELGDTGLINNTNRAVVVGILDELHRLLMRFGRLDERLRPLTKPFIAEEYATGREDIGSGQGRETSEIEQRFPQANELLGKALAFVQATSRYPARLRWAFCDKAKIEEVLSRTAKLSNALRDLLSTEQTRRLQQQEIATHYQIVQLNNKMDQLLEIVHAGFLPHQPSLSEPTDPSVRETDSRPPLYDLVQMAKFKALLSATNTGVLTESLRAQFDFGRPSAPSASQFPRSATLSEDDIILDASDISAKVSPSRSSRRSGGWYQPSETNKSKIRIWIESTSIEPRHYYDPNAGPDRRTMRRFEALVTLLRESQQTTQFRALPCLWYYLQTKIPTNTRAISLRLRYGLVFCLPLGVEPSSQIISLRELLSRSSMASGNTVPSLSERLKLMRALVQSVERLHAVGWLHKGLCSDSILFFCRNELDADVDLSQPYLSGFDYSRPVDGCSLSEAPTNSSFLDDVYRHPSVQGQEPAEGSEEREGFNRHHDIYSLGLVMLEIAEWRPVEEITLGLHTWGGQTNLVLGSNGNISSRQLTVTDVLHTRETLLQLLEVPERSSLAAFVGSAIAKAIWSCIEGDKTFGSDEADQGRDGMACARIQAKFYTAVTKPLFDVHIV